MSPVDFTNERALTGFFRFIMIQSIWCCVYWMKLRLVQHYFINYHIFYCNNTFYLLSILSVLVPASNRMLVVTVNGIKARR